jgi:hypothetical protein
MTRESSQEDYFSLDRPGVTVVSLAESPLPARMAAPTFVTALPCRLEFGAGFNDFLQTPLLPSALPDRLHKSGYLSWLIGYQLIQ